MLPGTQSSYHPAIDIGPAEPEMEAVMVMKLDVE
jgi:hypothetical protein